MEEMMDDTLEMEGDEDLEEEADAEVDKVLFDLTDGKLGQAGKAGTELPVRCRPPNLRNLDESNHPPSLYSRRKTSWRKRRPKGRWSSTAHS